MAFPTVSKPVKSTFLNEYDLPTYRDQNGYTIPLLGIVAPQSNGNTNLPNIGSSLLKIVPASQVTGKRQMPLVGPAQIPMVALVGVDATTGLPVPFNAASANSVSGKYQSTVVTGTGASQSIAHGLGVAPSLILVSAYDSTAGGASPFVITEGVHTSSNLLITATAGLKYKVIAFA